MIAYSAQEDGKTQLFGRRVDGEQVEIIDPGPFQRPHDLHPAADPVGAVQHTQPLRRRFEMLQPRGDPLNLLVREPLDIEKQIGRARQPRKRQEIVI